MGQHLTKKFLTAKKIIKRMKRQPMEREKIFIDHISDKAQIAKNMENSYNSITTKNSIKKSAKGLNKHFSQEQI